MSDQYSLYEAKARLAERVAEMEARTLRFLTRDAAQRQVAERLGFAT